MDLKIIVEQHPDGFVAYPVGLRGIIVGQGETRQQALSDVTSAIEFHVETFGLAELESEDQVLDVFVANTRIAV
jgi:predicted RNase H-like HicB family nuclease